MKLRIDIFICIGLMGSAVFGQEVLDKQKAIALALEHNFGILISKTILKLPITIKVF